MSLDLSVRLPYLLSVSQFVAATQSALAELSSVPERELPDITIEEWYDGIAASSCSLRFFEGWNCLVYMGEEHLIELDTNSFMEDTDLGNGSYSSALFANISVRRTGADPVNWLLGAAAAIGLAREADSTIVVESTGWVNHLERAPDDFLKDILTDRRSVFLAAIESFLME